MLSLNFQVDRQSITSMRVLQQEPPWRAIRAFPNESGEAVVHLHNLSGGILGGDSLQLHVHLHEAARAQVTSVGATRVYRRKADGVAANHTAYFHVSEGAMLEYLPDALIPYGGSKFHQRSEFMLAQGAGLIAWDLLAAGRVEHGEAFSFEELTSTTIIKGPGRPIARERYSLTPARHDLRSPARFGRFAYSVTMWVCRIDDNRERWMVLERQLNTVAQELSGPNVIWGASALIEDGIVIRGLACDANLITKGLEHFWRLAKQHVWQRPALAPRKIN